SSAPCSASTTRATATGMVMATGTAATTTDTALPTSSPTSSKHLQERRSRRDHSRGGDVRSPATDILETALALHRAPGERFRLRERPLPPGVVHLIEIAGGAPGALRAAAEDLGEPEALLLDASRFYLEQMLFGDPDADAYRVLGVARDAPTEEIRRHHRLLQRWLHPDRAHAGDAAVFATRVNQAWSQLRAPEARAAYDARLATGGPDVVAAPTEAPVRRWHDDAPEPVGRRSRWLAATALAACAVLVFLMYRNEQRPTPRQAFEVATAPTPDTSPVGAAEAANDSALQEALARALEPAVDLLEGVREEPAPAPEPVAEPVPVPQAPVAAVAAPPRQVAPIAASAAPTVAPTRVAEPMAAPAPEGARRVGPPPPTHPPPPPQPPPPPAPACHPSLPRPTPPQLPPTAGAAEAAIIPVAAAQPAPPAVDPATRLMAERLRQAERRLGQVTAYLASSPDAAPMWNDADTAERAARLRARFDRHNG